MQQGCQKNSVAQWLGLSATAFFSLAAVALSYAQTSPVQSSFSTSRSLSVSDIAIPTDLGYVVETHPSQAAGAAPSPIIIHIQEAHTNYEAQKHLAAMLDQLVDRYGLKLILVEGGFGDVSLAYLRTYGPPENRREVAEKYLKAGILSGEEYLDIASDHALTLWGVEDKKLYQENVDAFLATDAIRASLGPVMSTIREAAASLKPRLFDPALTELETNTLAFQQQKMKLADYATFVTALAARHGISADRMPHATQFLAVHSLERSMDLAQVQQEQKAVFRQLTTSGDPKAVQALLEKAKGLKTGETTREAFYTALESLAKSSNLPLETSPHLVQYIAYLKQSAQIEPTALSKELDQLTQTLRTTLASTPQATQLAQILEQVDLMKKFIDLQLSPEEYKKATSLDLERTIPSWTNFLRDHLMQAGLTVPPLDRLEELNTAVPALRRFYEVAAQRDDVLVKHTIAKLQQTHEPLAVLITGGFHSPAITQMLKDRGLGVVVVAPATTQPTNEQLYHAVLKYKSGHGSLKEVLDLSGQDSAVTSP